MKAGDTDLKAEAEKHAVLLDAYYAARKKSEAARADLAAAVAECCQLSAGPGPTIDAIQATEVLETVSERCLEALRAHMRAVFGQR